MTDIAALPLLFQPLNQRGLCLRNRVVVSPMCQYQAEDGHVIDWHFHHHACFALGGVGMVEATVVLPEGPWQTIAPSPLAIDDNWPVPHEMTTDDIARIVESFRAAALRAREAGFKIVEIHGAYGYLIHEFFSPMVNQRTDQYGGPREARARVALEIAEAVRGVWSDDLPVWFRASAVDGAGVEIEDTVALALKEKPIRIGAGIVTHGRYVTFQLAEGAVPGGLFAEILRLIAELRPQPAPA